jgi:hypothetical protein
VTERIRADQMKQEQIGLFFGQQPGGQFAVLAVAVGAGFGSPAPLGNRGDRVPYRRAQVSVQFGCGIAQD